MNADKKFTKKYLKGMEVAEKRSDYVPLFLF